MPGVWRQAALRRREEVARSRILGAVAIGWLFTIPMIILWIFVLAHFKDPFVLRGSVPFLVITLVMIGVTEMIRRDSAIAIGALLGLMVLSQIGMLRVLHTTYWGWTAVLWIIIIGVLANALWGALELEAIRRDKP